jgi:hypothetical protein
MPVSVRTGAGLTPTGAAPPARLGSGHLDVPDQAARIEAAGSYTYAISDGTAVKIGRSAAHPICRLAALQVGNPRELRLVAWSVSVTEGEAHRRLHRWRLRGEWFRI